MTCHRIECVETEKALKEALNSFRIRTAQTAELNQLRRDLEHQLAESQAREQELVELVRLQHEALASIINDHGEDIWNHGQNEAIEAFNKWEGK
jgi:hypothetical protein